MESYRVFIKPSAAKELEAISSKTDRRRIVARIRSLALDPRPAGCVKLSGANKFRIRQGKYRIVYFIDDEGLLIVVVRIGHRRDVYRGEGGT